MRKLLILPLLLPLWQSPAFAQVTGPPPVFCNHTYAVSALSGPVAQSRIVQNSGNATISVCGWNIANTGGASVTLTFQAGTGTNCGTGTTNPGLGITVSNGAQNIDHISVAIDSLPQGTDLCWTITGTGNINGTIYYGMY